MADGSHFPQVLNGPIGTKFIMVKRALLPSLLKSKCKFFLRFGGENLRCSVLVLEIMRKCMQFSHFGFIFKFVFFTFS